MEDIAIKVSGLGKRYRKGVDTGAQLLDLVRKDYKNEHFWAIKDVSFEVRRGEMFGVVGPNGAGKSTLLKILSRLTRQNVGRVKICGRVGSLLEVGTGFHPELTGRENIFLNGALLGLPYEQIKRSFEEIVDFSGIGSFLETPIKRYSNGMKVRLGFAIASHLDQEILLLDEVMAVGDAEFRERSLSKMKDVLGSHRTVLFVGHDLALISTACDRAIWLDRGSVRELGPASEVAHNYLETIAPEQCFEEGVYSFRDSTADHGSDLLKLTQIVLMDSQDRCVPRLQTGQTGRFAVRFESKGVFQTKELILTLTLLNRRQQPLTVCRYSTSTEELPPIGEMICTFLNLPLMPGRYKVRLKYSVELDKMIEVPGSVEFTVGKGDYYTDRPLPPAGSCDCLFDHSWELKQM
jgi:lipopolysaccharide transport system ATP-binding protein